MPHSFTNSFANWLIVLGVILLLAGGATKLGLLEWFGRLPGDIRIESENTRVFIPLTSMVLISLALTLGVNLIRRIF